MPRTNRNLTEKITIQITRPMLADLQNVATKSGKPLAEIVRQAIRNHLWDEVEQKFLPHIYLQGSPFPKEFDEGKIYYHGGTAVARSRIHNSATCH